MNKCTHCQKELPDDMFGARKDKKNGLSSWCKPCNRVRSKEQYAKRYEKVRTYWKQKNQDPIYKAKHRDYCRERARRNPLTDKQKARKTKRQREAYRKSDLIRYQVICRGKTKAAIKNGILSPKPCEYPGCKYPNLKAEAHHWDYSQPMWVTWLCSRHHALADGVRRVKEIN